MIYVNVSDVLVIIQGIDFQYSNELKSVNL